MITSSQSDPDAREKKAIVRNIEAKLIEKQERLNFIKRKVKKACDSNRIQVSEQLLKAELHADSSLAALRTQIELLEKANNDSWESKRHDVNVAWDELSQAIKKVVSRFP